MRQMLVGAALTLGFLGYCFGIYLNHAPIHRALQLVWSR